MKKVTVIAAVFAGLIAGLALTMFLVGPVDAGPSQEHLLHHERTPTIFATLKLGHGPSAQKNTDKLLLF